MNFNNQYKINCKIDDKICGCCLNTGCTKYESQDSSEISFTGFYQEMMNKTFNVDEWNIKEGPSKRIAIIKETSIIEFGLQLTEMLYIKNLYGVTLICRVCVSKLQDACNFKNMVLVNVKEFEKQLQLQQSQEKSVILNHEIIIEEIKVEPNGNGIREHDDNSNGTCSEDDEILSNLKMELQEADKNKTVKKRFPPNKLANKATDKHCGRSSWKSIRERRGNGPLLRKNSLKLLANSSILVFQWNKSRYRCFCCKEPFSDMDILRQHTKNHSLQSIERKIISQQNRLVKVEISKLYCTICDTKLQNLSNLREHLNENHKINFITNDDLLIPFKIENELQCQICSEKFPGFRLLNIHMNKHFQKQVCHICGAGFSNVIFLNLHKIRYHKTVTCKTCDITFKNKRDKKQHDINVHNVKFERKLRFPCPYCPERYLQESSRVQHLVEKHGMNKPEYKCPFCTKVFLTKSICNNHTKYVHKKERIHECDICHHFFYTKSDVARHQVTHSGEKKFVCTLCNNLFASKDSLRRHTKRSHERV